MSTNIYIFIYIASLIAGTAAMTIAHMLGMRGSGRWHRAISLFFPAILVYSAVDFVTYYYLFEIVPPMVIYAMITLPDTLFLVMSGVWLYTITVMSDTDDVIRPVYIAAATAIYIILQEGGSLIFGRFENNAITISPPAAGYYLQALGIISFLINLAASLYCTYRIIKSGTKGPKRTISLIFSVSFAVYTLWVAHWDYTVWFLLEDGLSDDYANDLIFIIYLLLSVSLAVYFKKCDPLKLKTETLVTEDTVNAIADKYGLTVREREVLVKISEGKGNAQIADALCISENTVKRHITSIMKKTGCRNRNEVLFKISRGD